MVTPSAFRRLNSAMISRPWLECRLPVGSSAREHRWTGDDGARHGDELLLATGQLAGVEILLAHQVKPIQRVTDQGGAL